MDTYLKESFDRGNVQLFVGSGLSKSLYPDVNRFRKKLLQDPLYIGAHQTTLRKVLDNSSTVPLEDVAEFYELHQGTDGLMRMIRSTYGTHKRPIDIHEKLWKLPHIQWIYTTNFDCLIEDALNRPKQRPIVITRAENISDIPPNRRVVFKPHGCARESINRSEFVITRNDYLNYSHRRTLEMLLTIHDISTHVFVFLGYSLMDLNMRHIIVEAARIGRIKSYAVMKDTTGPEARYWERLGVTLIEQSAEEFVAEISTSFPPAELEWDEKADERVEEKEEIASKSLIILKNAVQKHKHLNLMIDAGSSTLYLASAISREVLDGNLSLEHVRIITNSPLVMNELTTALARSRKEVSPFIIGGPFRIGTRAYTPGKEEAVAQVRKALFGNNYPTLAFIGATAMDKKGLRTNTKREIAVKQAYIKASGKIYVLADHSKVSSLSKGYVFSNWKRKKMQIITDRPKSMKDLRSYVKRIR